MGEMVSFSAGKKPHAVCIPSPFQGHINAMLKVAKLLHFKGFHVTFVNTEFHHQRILKSRGPDSLKGLPDFQFETISDGLPPCDIDSSQDLEALSIAVMTSMLDPVRNLISKLNERSATSDTPQVTCIIADGAMTSPLEAAEELGIPGVILWTMCASFMMINLHCGKLAEKGVLPIKDKSNLEIAIDFIPGLRDLRVKDLPWDLLEMEDPENNFVALQLKRVSKASAIIINTFDALESEVLEAMKPLLPPIYTVGPLLLLPQNTSSDQLNSVGSNLWKEDEECLTWLDSKDPNSVLYVNFGSIAVLSSEELTEFAWGLANSNKPFLWILRPGIVTGEGLPVEFTKETSGRGLIARWCPQEQVLSHPSIGGFLTHSGWNSTMDAICSGVPLLSWPFMSDQLINCRYACVHWGIAMEVDKVVKRDELGRLVREMMDGEKGRMMKISVEEWMNIAENSTKPGGSSYLNFDKVIKEVLVQNKLD